MGIFVSILANKTLTAILFTWGITAAWGWYSGLEEKLQYQQAMESYKDAFSTAQERYTQLDNTMRVNALQRRDIRAKSNTALEGLNSVSRSEVKNKMGGACGPYGQRIVPRYYVDILRIAAQQTPNRSEAKKQSSSSRIIARLRAAFTRKNNANSGGIREESPY